MPMGYRLRNKLYGLQKPLKRPPQGAFQALLLGIVDLRPWTPRRGDHIALRIHRGPLEALWRRRRHVVWVRALVQVKDSECQSTLIKTKSFMMKCMLQHILYIIYTYKYNNYIYYIILYRIIFD